LIVIDTSALVAILEGEPDAGRLARLIYESEDALLAAGTYVECCIVRGGRAGWAAVSEVDGLIQRFGVRIAELTVANARIVREAYLRFGKGIHPAGLNFGDCFAYALAKELDRPLLFKGDDFARTDIRPAIRI
jgi:ribonuclease VapC